MVPMVEISQMCSQLKGDQINPRDVKMKLAYEITKINAGEAAANSAQENFIKTIQKKELPVEMDIWEADQDQYNILDILADTKLVSSKSEAKRLVEQGAIKVKSDAELSVVDDIKTVVKITGEVILQRGKFHFVKVVKK
jgi:tyrosyl-tRNA synthetase